MTIHTYICNDGYTRTRCRAHIARSGPYAPHPTKHGGTPTPDKLCVECEMAAIHAPITAEDDPEE